MQFFYESLTRKIRCGLLVGYVAREVIDERSGENRSYANLSLLPETNMLIFFFIL